MPTLNYNEPLMIYVWLLQVLVACGLDTGERIEAAAHLRKSIYEKKWFRGNCSEWLVKSYGREKFYKCDLYL